MSNITRKEIIEGVCGAGVGAGDILFCHTSLRSFGEKIEGGPNGLIDALLEAVSPGGTIAAPTHGHPPSDPPFDPKTSPMYDAMGGFPKALCARPGALRSYHPSHSDVALGPQAEWLIAAHELSGALGVNSPLNKIRLHPQGKVVLFGVDYTTMTLIHLAELLAGLPYIGKAWGGAYPPTARVIKDGEVFTVSVEDIPGVSEGFNAVEPYWVDAGLVIESRIRDCRVRVIPAGQAVDVLVPVLKEKPDLLLMPPDHKYAFYRNAHRILEEAGLK